MTTPGALNLVLDQPGRGARTSATVALLTAVLTCLAIPTSAQDRGPVVEVTGLDGRSRSGRLTQVAPEIVLQTEGGRSSLAWSEVLSLRPTGRVTTTHPAAPGLPLHFDLADGSSFAGAVEEGDQDGFVVRLAVGVPRRLELSAVRSIQQVGGPPPAQAKFRELREVRPTSRRPLHEEAGSSPGGRAAPRDVAVVARRDDVVVLRGRVRQIGAERVLFEWNDRELPLPWSRLGGLVLARPSPRSAMCTVRLGSGDVFAGRVVGGSESTLLLRCGLLGDLEFPWADIERVDCRSERLVFLSELRPLRYEFEPFFDKKWDYALDRTLTGGPIRLGGRACARGVTMHSRARLTYRIDGRFRQFAAIAGVVDEMEGRGCVTLRVIGDGRVLWEAAGVRGGQPPRQVVVPLEGVQELTLVVDYDQELDLSDHAAWGLARLIR